MQFVTQSPAHHPLPWLGLLLYGLSLLLAAVAAYGLWSSLPQFNELFASFGATLPAPTMLLIEYPYGIWNGLRAGLLHVLAWLLIWAVVRQRWAHRGVLLATLLIWLAVALLIVALYLPLVSLAV